MIPGRRHALAPPPDAAARSVLDEGLGRLLARATARRHDRAREQPLRLPRLVGGPARHRQRVGQPAAARRLRRRQRPRAGGPGRRCGRLAGYLALAHVSDTWRNRWAHTVAAAGRSTSRASPRPSPRPGFAGPTVYELVDGEDPAPRLAAALTRWPARAGRHEPAQPGRHAGPAGWTMSLPSQVDALVAGRRCGRADRGPGGGRQRVSVLVLERWDLLGGTTALAGGRVWVPGNHLQDGDCLAAAPGYLAGCSSGRYPQLTETFLAPLRRCRASSSPTAAPLRRLPRLSRLSPGPAGCDHWRPVLDMLPTCIRRLSRWPRTSEPAGLPADLPRRMGPLALPLPLRLGPARGASEPASAPAAWRWSPVSSTAWCAPGPGAGGRPADWGAARAGRARRTGCIDHGRRGRGHPGLRRLRLGRRAPRARHHPAAQRASRAPPTTPATACASPPRPVPPPTTWARAGGCRCWPFPAKHARRAVLPALIRERACPGRSWSTPPAAGSSTRRRRTTRSARPCTPRTRRVPDQR